MTRCKECRKYSSQTTKVLSVCGECICKSGDRYLAQFHEIHAQSRKRFGLAALPPSAVGGVSCGLCQNECKIPAGGRGYCGVRRNEKGYIVGGTAEGAAVSWYFDPLPTNCVADWVCARGSGAGYPQWAYRRGPEHGYVNLAVFYQACTFDCLFCQNWHYRERSLTDRMHTAEELAESVNAGTSCICFFGGDPTPQLPHALAAAKLARKQNNKRILRICWETNGSLSPSMLEEMMSLSVESGGCVKFDLKAMDKNIHYALCGVDNSRTLENFAAAAKYIPKRPEPPPLVASTLLVPGYIDEREVEAIASYIAGLNPDIPYALLGFHGDFLMTDLPTTSLKHAEACLEAAKNAGLKRVRLGNVHLLG